MSRQRSLAGVLATLLSGACILAPAAGALERFPRTPAPTPTTAPAVVDSWAVAPTGTNPGQPSSRPNLSYDLAPGAKVNDSVTVFNYGNQTLTFAIYATDAFNDPTGGFDLLTGDKTATDAGSWVTLPQSHITVKPLTSVQLPITITVPAEARPGDHSAAILASSTVTGHDPDGKIVNLDRRAGTRLYVRVAGPLQPLLTIQKVKTTYHAGLNPFDGSLDVSYTVKNIGNERLGTHQQVEIKTPFGRRMKGARGKDLVEILPGNSVTSKVHFSHVTAAVRLTAQIVASPFPVGSPRSVAAAKVSRSGHAWAIPWTLLLAAAVICVLWQVWKHYRARRRQPTSLEEHDTLVS